MAIQTLIWLNHSLCVIGHTCLWYDWIVFLSFFLHLSFLFSDSEPIQSEFCFVPFPKGFSWIYSAWKVKWIKLINLHRAFWVSFSYDMTGSISWWQIVPTVYDLDKLPDLQWPMLVLCESDLQNQCINAQSLQLAGERNSLSNSSGQEFHSRQTRR